MNKYLATIALLLLTAPVTSYAADSHSSLIPPHYQAIIAEWRPIIEKLNTSGEYERFLTNLVDEADATPSKSLEIFNKIAAFSYMRDIVHIKPHSGCDNSSGRSQQEDAQALYGLDNLVRKHPALAPQYLEHLQQLLAYVRTPEGQCPTSLCRNESGMTHDFCTWDERMIFSSISSLARHEKLAKLAPACVSIMASSFPRLKCLQWHRMFSDQLGFPGCYAGTCGRQCFDVIKQFCHKEWFVDGNDQTALWHLVEIAAHNPGVRAEALEIVQANSQYLNLADSSAAHALGTIGASDASLAPSCYEKLLAIHQREGFKDHKTTLKHLASIACAHAQYRTEVLELIKNALASPGQKWTTIHDLIGDQLRDLGTCDDPDFACQVYSYTVALLKTLHPLLPADATTDDKQALLYYKNATRTLCRITAKHPVLADGYLDIALQQWPTLPQQMQGDVHNYWRDLFKDNLALFERRGMAFIEALLASYSSGSLHEEREYLSFVFHFGEIISQVVTTHLQPHNPRVFCKNVYLWAAATFKKLRNLCAPHTPLSAKKWQKIETAWHLSEAARADSWAAFPPGTIKNIGRYLSV